MAKGGRVKGDCLECPFHSWTFRGEDGYCENIPYTEKGINQVLHNFESQMTSIYPFAIRICGQDVRIDCFLRKPHSFIQMPVCAF